MENKSDKQRITDDINLLNDIIKKININDKNINKKTLERIIDLSKRYGEDAKFYLEKKDYVTAFGAINYAHGLLDAVRL